MTVRYYRKTVDVTGVAGCETIYIQSRVTASTYWRASREKRVNLKSASQRINPVVSYMLNFWIHEYITQAASLSYQFLWFFQPVCINFYQDLGLLMCQKSDQISDLKNLPEGL